MARIVFSDPEHTLGTIELDDGRSIAGPLPPASGEFREVYERLLASGVEPEPYVAPPRDSFFARELLAALAPDDYAAIQAAIATSAPLGLLWASLLAQGEQPIVLASERFQQGWAGLTAALGAERAAAIAAAMEIEP